MSVPKCFKILGGGVPGESICSNSVQEIPESLLHNPTFQRGSQNVNKSSYSSLNPDANSATSLALWLIQEPR